jgi:hypothetical protein
VKEGNYIKESKHAAVLNFQPTERGEGLSWWFFHRGRFQYANTFEKRVGFTVELTDVITAFIRVSQQIDPECQMRIHSHSGILFPEFIITIDSAKFDIQAEKSFAGGSSRENVFNYTVAVVISSYDPVLVEKIVENYQLYGTKPLSIVID